MKNQKGITLIALIITIIVLAILAAVSITSLTGKNGVITESLQTSENAEIADEKEKVTVAYMGAAMKNHGYGTTVEALQKELDETVGAGKTEIIEENGKLKVKFTDTGRTYIAGDVYTGEVNLGVGSGTGSSSGSESNWDEIVEDLASNSQEYLEKAQELGQETEIENDDGTVTEFKDVGIGTDGEVVNLSLWHYYKTDDGQGMSLGKGESSFGQVGYDEENLVDGKIQGTMPQYIYVASESKVYPVISLKSTFGRTSLKEVPQIPSTIISIYGAFQECTNLTDITLSNGVKFIGDSTFSGCTGLTSITLPTSVTDIVDYAFGGCTALTSITIPNSVTSIGESAFSGCTGLTSIIIPNSVTSIGKSAFSGCTGLTSITLPTSVTDIVDYAFVGCTALTSMTIPSSVTNIGNGIFSNCNNLTTIKVDAGNTKYDSRDDCNAIIETSTNTLVAGCKNTKILSTVTSIGGHSFYNCYGLTDITIPTSVTSIEEYAFHGCKDLINITIPNSVTTIGANAFWYCVKLKSITIPTSVTSIEDYAFTGCSSLTSITIPSSVTNIGNSAFSSCDNLATVYFNHTTAPTFGQGCFVQYYGGHTTFYFKNSTVASAFTTSHYNSSKGTISTDYSW